MKLPRTPSQTAGPYLSMGLVWRDGPYVMPAGTADAIWVRGRLTDGAGDAVPDGVIETWQADPGGRFAHPADDGGTTSFRGFGRCLTDADGRFAILTRKPGVVPDAGGAPQAPHIDVTIFARGLLKGLATRCYFDDEKEANAADSVLRSIADAVRRATLVAKRTDDGYRFDIVLQGEDETVFFDV